MLRRGRAVLVSIPVVDRYAVERELGRGGMAMVYLARDRKHDRLVAIKVLRPEIVDGETAQRFLREIQILSRLQHPNILALLDSGSTDFGSFASLRMTPRREARVEMVTGLKAT